MKILIASDTHGNLVALSHVLSFGKIQGVEAIIHCGDWCDGQAVKTILKVDIPLYAVMGNCDEAHKEEVWEVLQGATEKNQNLLETELDNRKIAIAHQPEKISSHIQSGKFDAIFHGHLHMSASVKTTGNTLIVNPGALGSTPKPSFAIYDTKTNTAELIEIPTL